MDDIQGKRCLFQIKIGDDYTTALCWKSVNASFDTEVKEITTRGDGRFKDFDYKSITYKVNGEGVTQFQNGLNATLFDFVAWQKEFKEIDYRVLYQSPVGLKVLRGIAIIENCSINAQVGQVSDGSIALLGKGEPLLEDAIPDLFDLFISIAGNDAIQASMRFKLLNVDGDTVFDSALLPESETNHLPNPTTVVVKVQKGDYAYWWQVITESDGNSIEVTLPAPEITNFNQGNNSAGTYPVLKDFNANRSVVVTLGTPTPPPACVDVAIVGTPTLPDGVVGEPYSYSFAITGSDPFTLSAITKPEWLIITIDQVNKLVIFSGTPDVAAVETTIAFNVDNCSTGSATIGQLVTIEEPAVPQVPISWGYDEVGSGNGVLRIYVNGVETVYAVANSSGDILVNAGDSIQAFVSGASGQTKDLSVFDGAVELFFGSGVATQTYIFGAVAGHSYAVLGTVTG